MTPLRKVAKSVAAELLRAEMLLLDPGVRRDRARVAALLTEDFFEFGKSGKVWTRERILELLGSEEYAPPVVEGFACHWVAPMAVLVTYRAVRANEANGEREITLRSSLWAKDRSGWRMRFHQGTRALKERTGMIEG